VVPIEESAAENPSTHLQAVRRDCCAVPRKSCPARCLAAAEDRTTGRDTSSISHLGAQVVDPCYRAVSSITSAASAVA